MQIQKEVERNKPNQENKIEFQKINTTKKGVQIKCQDSCSQKERKFKKKTVENLYLKSLDCKINQIVTNGRYDTNFLLDKLKKSMKSIFLKLNVHI